METINFFQWELNNAPNVTISISNNTSAKIMKEQRQIFCPPQKIELSFLKESHWMITKYNLKVVFRAHKMHHSTLVKNAFNVSFSLTLRPKHAKLVRVNIIMTQRRTHVKWKKLLFLILMQEKLYSLFPMIKIWPTL